MRSLFYTWKRREKAGRLENEKPIAKRIWWRTAEEKKNEVMRVVATNTEIASHWVIGKLTHLSATTVAKIRRERNEAVASRLVKRKPVGNCEWLKKHACWAIDTMHIRFMGKWLYLLFVLEEYSRAILGWKLTGCKSGEYSRMLIEHIVNEIGIKPLVIKHDRGTEFINHIFMEYLRREQIVSLASPGYYAPFNGKAERGIRLMRRFTRPFEKVYGASWEDIAQAASRGMRIINEVLPRRIFGGRTSSDIYEGGEIYRREEKDLLITKIFRKEDEEQGEYFLKSDLLDKHRENVVNFIQELNICDVWYGKSVKLFTT